MVWLRIDDQYPDHPKMVAAGDRALALDVRAMAYAARFLTDGFVPCGFLREKDAPQAEKLVKVGRWERVEGGYRIHDFNDYNPTKAHVEKVRGIRREIGKRGAVARWQRG